MGTTMKIGIYDPYLDDLGGGEKYMMTIAEVLSQKNDVDVFWDKKEDLDGLLQRFSLDLSKVKLVKNIFAKGVDFFQRLQATRAYDVIIVLSDGSIPIVLSKRLFLHLQQPLDQKAVSSIKNKLKIKTVASVFYNSEFTKSFNEKSLGGVSSTVIYPPVALHPQLVAKENIILHVGRFRIRNVSHVDDYKKQGVMIQSFKEMVDQKMHHDWKFVIAASVKEEELDRFANLQKDAEGYPIEFLINKTNDELWDIYSKAKIYWHASGYGENLDEHPEYAEHFGISTVEAMGAGAVPVVINMGGQTEIVTNDQNGFLWDNLGQMQVKTEQLILDPALLQKFSESAKKRAQDFSKEKFAEAILRLVEIN